MQDTVFIKFDFSPHSYELDNLSSPTKEWLMANIQAHCRFCGSDKVDTYRALNGIIVYECDACWRIWNSSKLKKVTNPQTEQ